MRAWEIDPSILKEPIIDIGAGNGPLNVPGLKVVPWDKKEGDAHYMKGVEDHSYATVYSHHCLEHLENPIQGLQNWWRILDFGGHLILTVPSRDYYEKRRMLPSIFNPDHKTMWRLDDWEPPNTFSLSAVVRAACPDAELILLRLCLDGYVDLPPETQSPEGFHCEGVWRKTRRS